MIEFKTGDPPEVHTCQECGAIHDLRDPCLCPECGKPYVDISHYPKWGKPPGPARLFIHKKRLRRGPFPHYEILESCLVKGAYT